MFDARCSNLHNLFLSKDEYIDLTPLRCLHFMHQLLPFTREEIVSVTKNKIDIFGLHLPAAILHKMVSPQVPCLSKIYRRGY